MDETPLYMEAAFAAFGRELANAAPCHRCTDGAGVVCRPCAVEIGTRLTDPDDELVSIHYSGHGFQHGDYRQDVTR